MPRSSSSRTSSSLPQPQERWHMWVLTLLALAIGLLTITLLMKRNVLLTEKIDVLRNAQTDLRETVVAMIADQERNNDTSSQQKSVCDRNQFECLYHIDDAYYPMGLATLEGYYRQEERQNIDGTLVSCNAFVVTGGSESLLIGWESLSESGSGAIPRVSVDGAEYFSMALNLDNDQELHGLSVEAVETIMASTADSPVELRTFVRNPVDVGVSGCFAPAMVLGIDE